MKGKEVKELINKTLPELHQEVNSLVAEINKIQVEISLGKLKNTNLIGNKKKDIARLKTVIRIKEQAEK